jgi:RNA ligase (TIGR02306 family)
MSWFGAVVVPVKLEKHENADSLSLVRLKEPMDVTVVVNTNDWVDKQKAVFCMVDSILPAKPEYDFVGKGYRVRAKRLRGIFSCGILLPAQADWEIGQDVTEILGIKKYEEPFQFPQSGNTGKVQFRHGPSNGVRYTDIESLRKYPNIIEVGEEVLVSEKIHGANGRFVWQDGELHAGTHNNWLKHPDDCPYVPLVNCWWNVAKKYNLKDKLQQYPNIEFFGEVYGYVQFLRYDHKPGEYSLRIFDAFDISAGKYIDKATLVPMLKNIDMLGPPIMYLGPWPGYEAAKPWANGKSLIAENIREGFVVRPLKERYHDKVGRVILKLVGEDFLVSSGKQK